MVLKRKDKVDLSNEYGAMLDKVSGLMVFDYRGLKVSEVTELRAKVGETGASMRVVKNRMLKRAIEGRPYDGINEVLLGPSAVIFAGDDPVAPAKALVDFAKNHEAIQIKGGMVSNTYLDAKQAEELAKIPSMPVLQAKILGGIKAPASNLLGNFKGMHQKLHGLMKAYAEKLESAA